MRPGSEDSGQIRCQRRRSAEEQSILARPSFPRKACTMLRLADSILIRISHEGTGRPFFAELVDKFLSVSPSSGGMHVKYCKAASPLARVHTRRNLSPGSRGRNSFHIAAPIPQRASMVLNRPLIAFKDGVLSAIGSGTIEQGKSPLFKTNRMIHGRAQAWPQFRQRYLSPVKTTRESHVLSLPG